MMGFAALLLGIAGWIVMCIPDCATAAIVPALLGTGLGSAELLRCRRRKKPVRLAAAAVLVFAGVYVVTRSKSKAQMDAEASRR